MKPKSAFLAAVLIACYVSFGYVSIFHLMRMQVQKEAQLRLKGDHLQERIIQFNFSEEEWEVICPDEREFSHEAKMYDVKSLRRSWGRVVVTAYCDHKETEMIRSLGKNLSDEGAGGTPAHSGGLLKLLSEKFLPADGHQPNPPFLFSKASPERITLLHSQSFFPEFYPPPEWRGC